jgi:phosphoglucosamine mutase
VGSLSAEPGLGEAYTDHLVSLLEGRRLDGLRLVVDSANGSASSLAAGLYEGLGAEVVAMGCEPDGTNINDGCGSTATGTLAGAVVEHGADLGLALDGDADRLLAVGPEGALVNGDELIALFALDLADRGQLAGNTVVVTVMTNLGFRLAMGERDIIVKETSVGDRFVLAALDKDGLSLGGEQSGHIIFRRLATTGDGLLTGLILADLVVRAGKPLSALLDGLVTRVPQVLVNVPVPDIGLLEGAEAVWSAVAEEEALLGDGGRVLLRPSGTEPLVRVMVEATGDGVAEAIAERLAKLVGFELQAAAASGG